jgi:hypothetical protein
MFGFEFMSREVYGKLKSTEITSSISSKPTNVESIPFPAATIIPEFEDYIKDTDHAVYVFMLAINYFYSIRLYKEFIKNNTNLQSIVEQFVCYEEPRYYLTDESPFSFESNREFVEFLKTNQIGNRLWFETRHVYWNRRSTAPFAETLTRFGLGFSFNLIQADELLDFDRYKS